MARFMSRALYALLFLSFISVGCDSGGDEGDDDDDEQMVVNPTFNVSTIDVPLDSGLDGITFFAQTSETVQLFEAKVTNPLGTVQPYNLQGTVFTSSETVPLQPDGTGFVKASGTWRIQFIGAKTTGTRESFDVTTTVNVSALREDETSTDR